MKNFTRFEKIARRLQQVAKAEKYAGGWKSRLSILPGFALLFLPRLLSLKNRIRSQKRGGHFKVTVLSFLGLSFWLGTFFIFYRVLTYFQGEAGDFGDLLAAKLLSMIFLTFFFILIFSNIIVSLSSFFLAEDLHLILATPTRQRKIYFTRIFDTIIDSSWMVIFFGMPVFFAYSSVYHPPLSYYLSLFLVLIPYLIIPASLGTIVTMLLVNVFPARRTKDILIFLSLIMIIFLCLLFRFLQPEKLVNPQAFSTVIDYFSALKTPSSPFLPSIWATNSLLPLLRNYPGDIIFYQLLLWSTGAASLVGGEWISSRYYTRGWSKSQEAGRAKVSHAIFFEKTLNFITRIFNQKTRALMRKDIVTFFRDSTQWSQLFLLIALVVIYLFNFTVLPLERSPLPTFYLKNVISFLNMGLAGFVLSAVAVRFIFSSISIEGKSFWIIKSSPLKISSLFWSKYIVGLLPLLVLAEVLTILTNHLLRVSPFMMILSSVTIFFMTFGIVSLGVGIGAIYPRFNVENYAQIATGFGGLMYMLWSMIFIGVVVVLEAYPVYVIFTARITGKILHHYEWIGIGLSFLGVITANIAATIIPLKMGLKRLSCLEL